MNKPEKLIIGYSLPGSIMVGSHEYTSTTKCKKTDSGRFNLLNTVSKRADTPDCFDKKWIPLSVKFITSLFVTPKNLSELCGSICLLLGIIFHIYVFWTYKATESYNAFEYLIYSFISITIIFALIYIFISKWHAAEHMAIACYNDIQSFNPVDIVKYDRIDPNCGSRIVVLIFIISTVYEVLFSKYRLDIHPFLRTILFLEFSLYYDRYIGIIKTPILKQITFWLQRYILTRDPDELQLGTAATSVYYLLKAYEEENSE